MHLTFHTGSHRASHWRLPIAAIIVFLLVLPLSPVTAFARESSGPTEQPALDPPTTLFTAGFASGSDGFIYQDDTFLGTAQSGYASGVYISSGAYSGGGLKVTLGGVDANVINGMSGGWRYTLNLASAQTGVALSFRYKVEQTATYEFDEYSRFLVSVDGALYGRGAKNYVDHIGGDGSSTQGNSSSYLPTTDWQQYQIYVGSLPAGNHTIILGGYNNKKDAADESTTILIDDVAVTGRQPGPGDHRRTGARRACGYQSVPQLQPGRRAVPRPLPWRAEWAARQPTTPQLLHECAGVGRGAASGAWATRPSATTSTTTATPARTCAAPSWGRLRQRRCILSRGTWMARGGGDGFDDDGSAVALGLEVARVLAVRMSRPTSRCASASGTRKRSASTARRLCARPPLATGHSE